ncbi:MAG: replication endonuclease [Flavobacteriaceae bacterium]|nr:replication endonuclease [Flavobacteriaceae bacterium]
MRHSVSTAQAIAVSEFSGRLLWCRPPSRQQLIDDLPFLGNRHSREKWWRDVNVPDDERGRRLAEELNARAYAVRQEAKLLQVKETLSSEEKKRIAQSEITLDGIIREREIQEELDALDAEQQDIRLRLPNELRGFLDRMHPARRWERENAIREYVGFDDLKLIDMNPSALSILASDRAKRHFRQFPPEDKKGAPIHQEPYHRKRRCEKWWRRRMRKRQRRALHYVEAAIGAVGGPHVPGRPLYVSDYSLESYKAQLRTTEEILEGLRLVCLDDPSVQIPMKELNARKKKADAAKRRLLMDAILARIEGLEWHLCWITITLPGRFVPHATNESFRKEEWDPELGPEEALKAIQKMHHDVMCLLREQQVRPMGWWNAQAQQSGTPHRHLLLACPTREDARAVCDAFWNKFASVDREARQAEAARMIPDAARMSSVTVTRHMHHPKARTVRRKLRRRSPSTWLVMRAVMSIRISPTETMTNSFGMPLGRQADASAPILGWDSMQDGRRLPCGTHSGQKPLATVKTPIRRTRACGSRSA